jgi:hypothetical protein
VFILFYLLNFGPDSLGLFGFIMQLQITHLFRATFKLNKSKLDLLRILILELSAEIFQDFGLSTFEEKVNVHFQYYVEALASLKARTASLKI